MKLSLAVIVLGIAAGVILAPAAALADFGIDPAKVFVDNLFPGAEAEYKITIYNQNDYETTFAVKVRAPDYTETGYEPLPFPDWVKVTPDLITIGAMEQSEVLVIVHMPENAMYSGKKAETWISYEEQETEGMVKINIASRLLISTRVEEETEPANTEAATAQPDEETEVTKPTEDAIQSTVESGDESGITVAQGEAEMDPPVATNRFPWAIPGSVLGALLASGVVFYLVRSKRQHT